MDLRSICLVALFAVPGAAASFNAAETSVPAAASAGLDSVGTDASLAAATAESAAAYGADALDPVHDALACALAVRVPVAIVWGDILASRERGADIGEIVPVQILGTITTPVTRTVTETVWEPAGVLGFLPPVTREVTRIVGYEESPVVDVRDVPVEVHVEWQETYWDHDGVWFPIQLALPVGVPLLADGLGDIVRVCDGSAVLTAVPTFPNEGHDHWGVCIGCAAPDPSALDGWYVHVLSAVARLGGADTTPSDGRGLAFAAGDVLQAAGLAAARFAADLPISPDSSADTTDSTGASHGNAAAPAGAGAAGVVGFSPWAFIAATTLLAAGAWVSYTWLRRAQP
jgi:hypothetical protein